MSLRVPVSLYQRHELKPKTRDINKKLFFICEGAITEIKYLEGIAKNKRKLGFKDIIEIIPLQKTDKLKGNSHPEKLVEIAKDLKKSKNGNNFEYNNDVDKIVILFDTDWENIYINDELYKDEFDNIKNLISNNKDEFIISMTNPCFEIWILLHYDGSLDFTYNIENEDINIKYDNIIQFIKYEKELILENPKISSSHRLLSKMISDIYNFNCKKRVLFNKLEDNFQTAIQNERNIIEPSKKLCQDIDYYLNNVSSNLGSVLSKYLN